MPLITQLEHFKIQTNDSSIEPCQFKITYLRTFFFFLFVYLFSFVFCRSVVQVLGKMSSFICKKMYIYVCFSSRLNRDELN